MREFLEAVFLAGVVMTQSVLRGFSEAFDAGAKICRLYFERVATRHDRKYALREEPRRACRVRRLRQGNQLIFETESGSTYEASI